MTPTTATTMTPTTTSTTPNDGNYNDANDSNNDTNDNYALYCYTHTILIPYFFSKASVAYKSRSLLPKEPEIKELKIFVDKKYETIILPVFGVPCPFHISNIKNIHQSVETGYTYLRINFFHPGAGAVGGLGGGGASVGAPDATYVKELTFRGSNTKVKGSWKLRKRRQCDVNQILWLWL